VSSIFSLAHYQIVKVKDNQICRILKFTRTLKVILRLKLTVQKTWLKNFKKHKNIIARTGFEPQIRDSISTVRTPYNYATEEALEVVVIFGLLTYIGKEKCNKKIKLTLSLTLLLTLTLQSKKLENERKRNEVP